ncbi:YqaJ-like viral recombinase domain [seawater metagenome]|uniref:YqaJ-like viral recombinase domain n=1 Tax=seawater metagenome TaxID=1561972 RepID=A0A5E8CJN5_9ZZZZ
MENCKDIKKYYDEIQKILDENFSDNDEVSYTDKVEIENIVTDTLNMYFDEILDNRLVTDIVSRHFSSQYKFTSKVNMEKGNSCFREYDEKYKLNEIENNDIPVPKEYQKLQDHFMMLFNLPQPEQRSKAWFDARYNMITASDIATALGENPYEAPENLILKKCDPDFPFLDNKFVHHGKKYEPTATMIYEHIYDVKVTEFGCLKDPKVPFLGASPDGICSKSTLNNKFSPRLGTMLEIKCPYSREIKTKGLIDGDICPHYYYCQVQIQEQCCELEDCDFWQCKLVEYESREEYLKDVKPKTCHSIGDKGEKVKINPLIEKGCILQFLPKNKITEFCLFDAKYIYPPRLDLSVDEYDTWVLDTLGSYKDTHPDIFQDYVFDQVIYWKLAKSHNVLIKRDKDWFKQKYPILKKFWQKVQDYRADTKKLEELKDMMGGSRNKYFRYNTSIKDMAPYFTEKHVLFLNNKWNDLEEDDVDECDDPFIDD